MTTAPAADSIAIDLIEPTRQPIRDALRFAVGSLLALFWFDLANAVLRSSFIVFSDIESGEELVRRKVGAMDTYVVLDLFMGEAERLSRGDFLKTYGSTSSLW
jgi:hypothetical protein